MWDIVADARIRAVAKAVEELADIVENLRKRVLELIVLTQQHERRLKACEQYGPYQASNSKAKA